MKKQTLSIALSACLVALSIHCHAQDNPRLPIVREQRPRLILRALDWNGPSVARTQRWMTRPEYQDNLAQLPTTGVSGAWRYLVLGDEEAGAKCVAALKTWEAPQKNPSSSPSYTGEELLHKAMIYDWLRNHPDFADPKDRQGAIAHLEWWGEHFKKHNSPGVVPFYSRNAGAQLGLTAIAIALKGDSPKADEFLAHAYKDMTENIGTIREAEDGATGGATYGYVHQFGALAEAAAAWRSGTDWDAAAWIKEHQGDWLQRQMMWQIWATYPNGWFWKEGDVWSGSHRDRNVFTMQMLAISDMYQNGYGRAHVDAIHQRWRMRGSYYQWRILWFYLFNNPDLPATALDTLPRMEVFSPKLHAYVGMRNSWDPDATIIHFKSGENADHHGTTDSGKFTIFSHGQPLAIKNGLYQGYKSAQHLYYRSPWSSNVVVFDGPKVHGAQAAMPDSDGHASWTTWQAWRAKNVKHPTAGKLLASESTPEYMRALADLSGSTYPDNSGWLRELVFLGGKYILVMDRVKPGEGVNTRWIMQSINPPQIDTATKTAIIDNGAARLFSRTLLPADATLSSVGGEGRAYYHKQADGSEVSWEYKPDPKHPEQMLGQGRLDVVPAAPASDTIYLHVLYPTTTDTAQMPACTVTRRGASYHVQVGELSYTFTAQ